LLVRGWWLTPIIPATKEAEIRKIPVRSQPKKIVCETLSQKKKKTLISNPSTAPHTQKKVSIFLIPHNGD
jgi:hypothetical protein